MINNLFVSMIFLVIALLLMRDFLNSVYPRLFEKIVGILKKTLWLALKIVFWPLGFVLSKLLDAVLKKELPGRRK